MASGVRVVPRFRWSAPSRWSPTAMSLPTLIVGLILFGLGDAFLVNARLGNTPWTVLAEGVARHTPLDIGTATIALSFVVLLGWIPLGERPGLGTIANALIIGTTVDLAMPRLPEPAHVPQQLLMIVAGIAIVAIGGALYLSTHHGPGPRDGWMTGLAKRLQQPLARVRIVLEVSVLVLGALLGGKVGVGTLAFALTIGWALTIALRALTRVASPVGP